jgi:adenylyltransferase/sulfurtransferase
MKFRELRLRQDPACPVCGEHPTIHELIDYEEFCGVGAREENHDVSIPEIESTDLKHRIDEGDDVQIVDVREPHEWDICNIGGRLIPMNDIPARVHELDAVRDIVVVCRTGVRSAQVTSWLRRSGFERVFNLRGGIHAWADAIDPSLPKY